MSSESNQQSNYDQQQYDQSKGRNMNRNDWGLDNRNKKPMNQQQYKPNMPRIQNPNSRLPRPSRPYNQNNPTPPSPQPTIPYAKQQLLSLFNPKMQNPDGFSFWSTISSLETLKPENNLTDDGKSPYQEVEELNPKFVVDFAKKAAAKAKLYQEKKEEWDAPEDQLKDEENEESYGKKEETSPKIAASEPKSQPASLVPKNITFHTECYYINKGKKSGPVTIATVKDLVDGNVLPAYIRISFDLIEGVFEYHDIVQKAQEHEEEKLSSVVNHIFDEKTPANEAINMIPRAAGFPGDNPMAQYWAPETFYQMMLNQQVMTNPFLMSMLGQAFPHQANPANVGHPQILTPQEIESQLLQFPKMEQQMPQPAPAFFPNQSSPNQMQELLQKMMMGAANPAAFMSPMNFIPPQPAMQQQMPATQPTQVSQPASKYEDYQKKLGIKLDDKKPVEKKAAVAPKQGSDYWGPAEDEEPQQPQQEIIRPPERKTDFVFQAVGKKENKPQQAEPAATAPKNDFWALDDEEEQPKEAPKPAPRVVETKKPAAVIAPKNDFWAQDGEEEHQPEAPKPAPKVAPKPEAPKPATKVAPKPAPVPAPAVKEVKKEEVPAPKKQAVEVKKPASFWGANDDEEENIKPSTQTSAQFWASEGSAAQKSKQEEPEEEEEEEEEEEPAAEKEVEAAWGNTTKESEQFFFTTVTDPKKKEDEKKKETEAQKKPEQPKKPKNKKKKEAAPPVEVPQPQQPINPKTKKESKKESKEMMNFLFPQEGESEEYYQKLDEEGFVKVEKGGKKKVAEKPKEKEEKEDNSKKSKEKEEEPKKPAAVPSSPAKDQPAPAQPKPTPTKKPAPAGSVVVITKPSSGPEPITFGDFLPKELQVPESKPRNPWSGQSPVSFLDIQKEQKKISKKEKKTEDKKFEELVEKERKEEEKSTWGSNIQNIAPKSLLEIQMEEEMRKKAATKQQQQQQQQKGGMSPFSASVNKNSWGAVIGTEVEKPAFNPLQQIKQKETETKQKEQQPIFASPSGKKNKADMKELAELYHKTVLGISSKGEKEAYVAPEPKKAQPQAAKKGFWDFTGEEEEDEGEDSVMRGINENGEEIVKEKQPGAGKGKLVKATGKPSQNPSTYASLIDKKNQNPVSLSSQDFPSLGETAKASNPNPKKEKQQNPPQKEKKAEGLNSSGSDLKKWFTKEISKFGKKFESSIYVYMTTLPDDDIEDFVEQYFGRLTERAKQFVENFKTYRAFEQ